jgi:hypothetical protein
MSFWGRRCRKYRNIGPKTRFVSRWTVAHCAKRKKRDALTREVMMSIIVEGEGREEEVGDWRE